MAGLFYDLGKAIGSTLRRGKWVFDSVTGSEADAIRAEGPVGRDLAQALLQQMPPDPDPEVGHYLEQMGACLASRVRVPQRRFHFRAVDVAERNAFALPGGYIFVTRPLLELCRWNTDEIAFILGHEMGHVLRGHAMERIVNGWMLVVARRCCPLAASPRVGWRRRRPRWSTRRTRASRSWRPIPGACNWLTVPASIRGVPPACSPDCRRKPSPVTALDTYFAAHPPLGTRLGQLNRYLRAANS